MPFWPEGLFELSARDRQVTWLDPVLFVTDLTAAAVAVDVEYVVPDGRILLLQNAVADFGPGAAQTVLDAQIVVRPVLTVDPFCYLAVNYYNTPAAPNGRFINWSGSIIVPPTWQVQALGNFSAGAAGNFVSLAVAGLLCPVGNVARL